jgi:hypothetical protein
MTLFSQRQRSDPTPCRPEEDSFSFLDRVDQVPWERVRNELEGWFDEYPQEEAQDLLSRFRSKDPAQHYAAWWELYLFRLFRCLGCTVEVHPELQDSTTHPDFRVGQGSGSFLLEATTTFSGIVDPGRDGGREAWVLAAVEKVHSVNFYVHVEFDSVGTECPKDIEITKPLQEWLDGLDPDEIEDAGMDEAPELKVGTRGWVVVFRHLPVKPEARGKRPDKRLVGLGPSSTGFVNDVNKIRGSLNSKARKYGDPDEPLVIAVLSLSSPDDEDIESAIFGSIAWRFPPGDPGAGHWVRQEEGLWFRGGEPRATKVSAVIVGVGTLPWRVAKEWPRMWINPWATQPLDLKLPLPTKRLSRAGEVVEVVEATATPAEIFHLRQDWPGPESPFGSRRGG